MITSRRFRDLALQRKRRQRWATALSIAATVGLASGAFFLEAFHLASSYWESPIAVTPGVVGRSLAASPLVSGLQKMQAANGRPQVSPLPPAHEVWECEIVVVGGSLGGIAAAAQAMKAGVQTCLIEVAPWLGGQISSQGVSAIDESRAMRWQQNFSESWRSFKRIIRSQPIQLPDWTGMGDRQWVYETNGCWVGDLCFLPRAGASASQQWLQEARASAPNSRWATATAFKGAAFDPSGRNITAVYAVRRTPKEADYIPKGRPSEELAAWYSWSSDTTYDKVPIRLQAPPGKRLMVIDATDTGELIGWARVPYRVGSDAQSLLGEGSAPVKANPACTQAFTFPFVLAIADDRGHSLQALKSLKTGFSKAEHRQSFDMEGFPMFHNRSLFNYRRIVSRSSEPAANSRSTPGEMTLVNWNRGNDWNIMDNPLIMDAATLEHTGQYQNWMGGVSIEALKNAENHALLFAEWLMETQSSPGLPLMLLTGGDTPLATQSGLSMMPYIREGRRIIGRPAYGQDEFMIREPDLRVDMSGGRRFTDTAIALAHYDIDIHGCRWRNWGTTYEATRASVNEQRVRPLQIPLEAIIPIGVDNLLIGGKSIAVSHIVNGMTRVHYGEWSVGAAAGATASWLIKEAQPANLTPTQIVVTNQIPALHSYLIDHNLRFTW